MAKSKSTREPAVQANEQAQAVAEMIRWNEERVAVMKERVLSVDSEAQLEQLRVLAYFLSNIADSPNEIDKERVAWVGSLLSDTVNRLDLALELECQKGLPTALANEVRRASAEVAHG